MLNDFYKKRIGFKVKQNWLYILKMNSLIVILLFASLSFSKGNGGKTEEEKRQERKAYFLEVEDRVEKLLNEKIKKNLLIIEKKDNSNFNEHLTKVRVSKETEITGLNCFSVREFLKNEGVDVKKIFENNIEELVASIKSQYTLDLKEILVDDFKQQREEAKTSHSAPAFCFADLKDKIDHSFTVFVSPTHLKNQEGDLNLRDFGITEASLKKDQEKSIQKDKKIEKDSSVEGAL